MGVKLGVSHYGKNMDEGTSFEIFMAVRYQVEVLSVVTPCSVVVGGA